MSMRCSFVQTYHSQIRSVWKHIIWRLSKMKNRPAKHYNKSHSNIHMLDFAILVQTTERNWLRWATATGEFSHDKREPIIARDCYIELLFEMPLVFQKYRNERRRSKRQGYIPIMLLAVLGDVARGIWKRQNGTETRNNIVPTKSPERLLWPIWWNW